MIQQPVDLPRKRSWRRAAKIVSRRHFSPYKLFVRRDLGLAVMLNPKVGSTTFRRVLVEGLQEAGIPPTLGPLWPVRLSRRYLSAPPADYIDVLSRRERYKVHCFVRNPYARLLSAWKDKFTLGPDGEAAFRSMKSELPVVRRFAASHDLPGGEPSSEIPFPTFVAYVASQPEGRRNQHWDTQRSVLASDIIEYDCVYQMETEFNAGMTWILTQIGLPESWVEQRLSTPRNASRQIFESVYDSEIAARVYEIFQADFEQFGYARDSWIGM